MEFESIGTGRVSADYSLRESRELGRSVGAVGASRCVVYSLVVLLVDYWEARDHTNTRTEDVPILYTARYSLQRALETRPSRSKYVNLGQRRISRK